MNSDLRGFGRSGTARLRKFPYPFKAALTILSDRHGVTDREQFLEFHKFLNTENETPHGRGLGLEIGDSFWFYDDIGKFSYFESYSDKPSQNAALIRDFVKSGYIDCLHTYGDFTNKNFERKYAEWAQEELAKHDIKLPVWVNHGNENNIQNVNNDVAYHQGATPGSPAYHMDITAKLGTRFLWRYLTPVIGQDRPMSVMESYKSLKPGSLSFMNYAARRMVKKALVKINGISGMKSQRFRRFNENQLINELELRDGTRIYDFQRYNNHPENIWAGVEADDLPRQLHPDVLETLVKKNGYMIIYNHLEYGDFYSQLNIGRLKHLASLNRSGEIWITTAARMLHYNFIYKSVRWDEQVNNRNHFTIAIKSEINDPVFGGYTLSTSDFAGITFVVPARYETSIRLDDEIIQSRQYNMNNKETCYSIPVPKLDYPDY